MKHSVCNLHFHAIVACFLLFAAICYGQATTATVMGTITDSRGAAVTGATITITNMNTGIVSKATTTDTGLYRIPGLIPGTYRINVSREGFNSIVKDEIDLHVEDQVALNFALRVGSVSESVTVEAGEPLVDTESTSLGEVIESRQVESTPLNGRNTMNLIGLVAGVVPQGTTGGAVTNNQSAGSVNPAGFGNYQIAGGIAGWNATFVDGGNVNASGQNWQSLVPTQDSIGEFKVDTNSVSPQYGRFGGGVINFSTKSGANAFHGTAYNYLRNTLFDANTFFNNLSSQPRTELHQNQFGATSGGPIKRDRAFVFFSWESFRYLEATSIVARVPTSTEMSGDFTADVNSTSQTFIADAKDPNHGQASCAGVPNTVCSTELDATAAAMYRAGFFANPVTDAKRLAADEIQGGNWDGIEKQPNNNTQYVVRVDQQINQKNRLFGRYTYWGVDIPHYSNDLSSPAFPGLHEKIDTNQIVLSDNWTISNTTNADLHIAANRFIFDADPKSIDLSTLGTNWSTVSKQILTAGHPTFMGSWANIPNQSNSMAQHNYNDNYSASIAISQVKGTNIFTYGGEARRIEYYAYTTTFPNGNFYMLTPYKGGNNITAFAEGVYYTGVSSYNSLVQVSPPSAYNYYQGYYINDNYKMSPKLTLNLGVRWELPGSWMEKHDHASVLLPNAANPLGAITNPAGADGGPTQMTGIIAAVNSSEYKNRAQTQTHWHLFEPRLGVNYSLNPNTVMRFGAGMIHPCVDCGASNTEIVGSPFSSASTPAVGNQYGANYGSLSNPYPNGILQPLKRSLKTMLPYNEFSQTLLGTDVGGVEPSQPFTYVLQWNANVEHSFGSSVSMLMSYIGSRGVHLGSQDINLNQLPDQYDSLGDKLLTKVSNPLYGSTSPTSQYIGASNAYYGRFLLPHPEFSSLKSYGNKVGESSYNGVIVEAKKQFRSGTMFDVNYTWSHLITNEDSQNGYLEAANNHTGYIAQDYTNLKADRSNSAADIRHRIIINYIYDLPFGKGRKYIFNASGLVNGVVSGWSLSGITNFQSGMPIGLTTSTPNYLQSYFGAGQTRPNAIAGAQKKMSGSAHSDARRKEWFNTAAFAQPGNYEFGNESRVDSTLCSQGVNNFDMSVSKLTPISKGINIQFRAELFNMFNHAQFGPPGGSLGSAALSNGEASFGRVTSQANKPRIAQFSLRLNY
ncbi:MAG: carboxypeptidase-like regulatory domain-containing protein [Anaerolineaceae bacterium]|nr:carboxypeptidase-like regulatory domain-containing protein [Anaerolineaceae bacterium]